MLGHLLSAVAALLGLLGLWVTVQAVARRFARQHPETGPYNEAGGGCGGGCGGCGQPCASATLLPEPAPPDHFTTIPRQ